MNNFFQESNKLDTIDEKLASKPEYKKMLNNLLGIGTRDNSVFVSSKVKNIDLQSLLSKSDYEKIFTNKSFKVEIKEISDDWMIEHLSESTHVDEFINIMEENGSFISIADRKLLENDFEDNKSEIILKFKRQKNKKIAKWKRFINNYLDQQTQSNSWSLYIGTMFIKVKTSRANIYAPLLLKKVSVGITSTNRVFIKSIDEFVDVNEKLLFLLQNEFKFNLPNLDDNQTFSFDTVIDKYGYSLWDIISDEFDFRGKFSFLTKKEANNTDLEYAKGAILTITSPSGGKLRNKLIDLLDTTDLDNLLDVDVIKNLNKDIQKHLEDKEGVYRITNTDISQEKAIIGSMLDSSIIWGPPGTGKSQTISNIIANILAKGETAIITSEKKAALDVIQERMGKLSKFMFFGLTDKNINKKIFYKPFMDLIDSISESVSTEKKIPDSIITDAEWTMLDQKDKLMSEDLTNLSDVWNSQKEHSYSIDDISKSYKWLSQK